MGKEEKEKSKIERIEERIEKLEQKNKKLEKENQQLKKQIQKENQKQNQKDTETKISRRGFLKKLGLGAAGLGLASIIPSTSALNIKDDNLDIYTGTSKEDLEKYLSINQGGPIQIQNTDLNLNNNSLKKVSQINGTDVTNELINQKERIDQLRLDFALDGVGLQDAFYENFTDTTNITDKAGINISTGSDGYAQQQDFININETVKDGKTYSYDLLERASVASIDVSITGVDNPATDSKTGTLSSGTAETAEVVSDKAPTNEEITLTPQKTETQESTSGTISGPSGTINIPSDANYKTKDISINLQGVDGPSKVRASWPNAQPEGANYYGYLETPVTKSFNVDAGRVKRVKIGNHPSKSYPYQVSVGGQSETNGNHEFTNLDPFVTGDFSATIKRGDEYSSLGGTAYEFVEVYFQDDAPVQVNGQQTSATGSRSVSGTTINLDDVAGTLSYTVSWTEVNYPTDVSGSVGSTTISESGPLTSSITRSVDLSDGSNDIDLSYSGYNNALDYDLSWTEITETQDPTVTINGMSQSYSGTLTDGSTSALSFSVGDLQDGTNNIDVSMTGDPTGGPPRKVGLDVNATTDVGAIKLGTFSTDYVVEELVASNTIENGDKTDVNIVIEDADGNTQIVDDTNIDEFVEPSFTGQNANVTVEIEDSNVKLKKLSLFTDDTSGTS